MTTILEKKREYISLTNIIKTQKSNLSVSDWLRNKNTVEYLGIWESIYNPNFNYDKFAFINSLTVLERHTISAKEWVESTNAIGLQAKADRPDSTYAHPDIAFEFAMWISPKFKIYLIKEFQRLKAKEHEHLKSEWNLEQVLNKVNTQIP